MTLTQKALFLAALLLENLFLCSISCFFRNEIPTTISNRALLVRVVCPQNNSFLWTKNSKTAHDNMLQQMLHNCACLNGKYFFVKFFTNILKIFFLHLAEFSNKDIVQDLNRLLKLGASGNSSTLRKWYYSLMTANCKNSFCGNNTYQHWYVGGPCNLKRKAWYTSSKKHKLSNIQKRKKKIFGSFSLQKEQGKMQLG